MDKQKKRPTERVKFEDVEEVSFEDFEKVLREVVKVPPEKKTRGAATRQQGKKREGGGQG